MFRFVLVTLVAALALASPVKNRSADPASPIHIIKPPVRCPEGMKPDANGRCRVVWDRTLECQPDSDGLCLDEDANCVEPDCLEVKAIEKRDVDSSEEVQQPPKKFARMESIKTEKRSKKRNLEDGKQARSKHAFIMMLKKKKMHQMMKPKPPPPPPPHHHPPHHHHEESEEPEEEEAEEEATPAPERLFFGDEGCIGGENATGACPPGTELVENVETNDFKEWPEKPEKSSESSSDSSSDSSSSDSTGESESAGESEDEVLEKAIKIKLMKIFRMKQRYGPALRRWLVTQLREYEDSFNE